MPDVNELAPDFELPTQDGTPLRLSQLRGRKVVLYFYPKDDTPGCTTQACGLRDAWGELVDVGHGSLRRSLLVLERGARS